MSIADTTQYLEELIQACKKHWPDNRIINIVCHGHSVPAGYFATPFIHTFASYPHLLHRKLAERFPFAVINVIVTAIGGENSQSGAARFEEEVLTHKPNLITLDYGLNDRYIGLDKAEASWRQMIEKALKKQTKLILLTPSWDDSAIRQSKREQWEQLGLHTQLIRTLASEYEIGLADSFEAFEEYHRLHGESLTDLLSWSNHPSSLGHELIAKRIFNWYSCY